MGPQPDDGADPPAAAATAASVSYHLPAPALGEAVTTDYLVKVTGPRLVGWKGLGDE